VPLGFKLEIRIQFYIHFIHNYTITQLHNIIITHLHSNATIELQTRLTPYAEEIIGDHQCGFRRNRSTTDHVFCIRQIRDKKWEQNEAVHQLFEDFKKSCDEFTHSVGDRYTNEYAAMM
jgi:hypothetical protein